MPNFAKAVVATTNEDLGEYKTFLSKLAVGNVVNLPLGEGENSRRVMRSLNAAAQEVGVRLGRLSSPNRAVKFRVMPAQKRAVSLSPQARKARAAKAQATRAAKRRVSAPVARGRAD